MKPRTIYILFASLLAVGLTSCENWLQIEPQYEITDTDLYKNTAGYYKVVNGLYYQMSNFSLYGKELSWGMNDVWARCYQLNSANSYKTYPQMYDLDYSAKEAAGTASAIWSDAYHLIAQANDLITHAEAAHESKFDNQAIDRNTILGEGYAVRAMMHFELLRLFATPAASDPDGVYISYVTEYPSTVNPPVCNSEFMGKVIADLTKARELLKLLDVETNPTYVTAQTDRFFGTTPSLGRFYASRGVRLNYYAVTALLARCNLWAGKTDDALEYAQELIGMVTDKKLQFLSAYSLAGNPKSFDDLLFGFYHEKLVETYEPYANTTNPNKLIVDDKTLFTGTTGDKRAGFINTSTGFMQKYVVSVDQSRNMVIPNIRLSEMYYIAAECLYQTDMKTAAANLSVVRKARGISAALSATMDETAFWQTLTDEYRKEFIGEGQLIFFYKRTGRPMIYSEGNFDPKGKLVLPIPDSESAI